MAEQRIQDGTAEDRSLEDARRKAPRFPYRADVEVTEGGAATQGTSLDVSSGGLRVSLDRPIEVGTVCDLIVRSPTQRVFHNSVRVVWQDPGHEGRVVGLEFL